MSNVIVNENIRESDRLVSCLSCVQGIGIWLASRASIAQLVEHGASDLKAVGLHPAPASPFNHCTVLTESSHNHQHNIQILVGTCCDVLNTILDK